MDFMIND